MKSSKLAFTLALLLVACQSSGSTADEIQAANPGGAEQEGVVQLDPQLPTGVHLQAVFQLPETLEGAPTVHDELRYLVYLPQGYGEDPDREWPLIYFLHGSGADDNDATFVLNDGLPSVLMLGEQPEDFPFLVISPQAFPGETWRSPEMIPALGALLDGVDELYQVDNDRVYLTGSGMGGYGSWWLATAYPDRFAAMASISGSGYGSSPIPNSETLCRLGAIPIWAIHGAQDQLSEPAASQNQTTALRDRCGGDIRWTLYDELGHIGTYERAYRDPALYAWMLEHSR